MPDLLAHVLIIYTACMILAWHFKWITQPYITVAMAGAMIPDLSKVSLLIPSWQIQQWLSLPFSWTALHTTGGILLSVLIGVTLVQEPYRERVAILLVFGAGSHLTADSLLISVSETPFPIFWPVTIYTPPIPGIYLSTDPWPTAVAMFFAVAVTMLTRVRKSSNVRFPPDNTE